MAKGVAALVGKYTPRRDWGGVGRLVTVYNPNSFPPPVLKNTASMKQLTPHVPRVCLNDPPAPCRVRVTGQVKLPCNGLFPTLKQWAQMSPTRPS